ncbi:MAG: hypothetical protein NTW49_11445 [Bacteroidia bacterium]|nr:hypothetical protein [Bacteroidia bacterium]
MKLPASGSRVSYGIISYTPFGKRNFPSEINIIYLNKSLETM